MINEHVFLSSPELVLVPYLRPFVSRYHEWMCDPALLAATESEPLSLEEEYENQHSWLHSLDKLTFILLAPVSTPAEDNSANTVSLRGVVTPVEKAFGEVAHQPTNTSAGPNTINPAEPPSLASFSWNFPGSIVCTSDHTCAVTERDEALLQGPLGSPLLKRFAPSVGRSLFGATVDFNAAVSPSMAAAASPMPCENRASPDRDVCASSYVMVGDCNLFLLAEDEEEEGDGDASAMDWLSPTELKPRASTKAPATRPSHTFEVEVMVADRGFRRRGLAEAAVRMLMQYAIAVCGATRFVAKILDSNVGSVALFTEHLKFEMFKEVKVFHEVHLARSFTTAEELHAWKVECERRSRASAGKSLSLKASSPGWWCGPLTEAVASSLSISAELPVGCVLP